MSRPAKPWFPAALSLMMVGWGANQFVSLLVYYRQEHGFSEIMVTSMLGVYVLGLVPALLLGGRYSDRTGRKHITLFAVALSMTANVAMMGSVLGALPLFAGRLMAGVATGLVMAAATSWVKELSQAPWDLHSVAGSGARRASLLTSAGFWFGPVVGGLLANNAPAPAFLPYAVHIALCVPVLFVVARLPETRIAGEPVGGTEEAQAANPRARKRFRLVVAPAAPWVFASGTTGFAVVPAIVPGLGEGRLAYATAAVAITLGCSVLIQPLARRLDTVVSARSLLTGALVVLLGLAALLAAILVPSPALGLVASAVLGCGNGLLMVGGLLEIQRLAAAHELGKLTGFFYTLAYVGFLAPTAVAVAAQWIDGAWIILAMMALALVSLAFIGTNSRKFLPHALERVEPLPVEHGREQKTR
ncbi:MFS transporter [Arthrobacter sp. AQ5-05]|uniref:MFS transporter n=1 Tax=Arthrobacter sp. AQ5-05 TaxID=2184581 RepID=UPI000DCC966E|nr:MFS transporter [Arthrobacter sp. AQ5-05]RAX48742.1 MFS transporter [Arthrobacter sp. AQ5-05]